MQSLLWIMEHLAVHMDVRGLEPHLGQTVLVSLQIVLSGALASLEVA